MEAVIGTGIVFAMVAGCVIWSVRTLIRDKKKGKSCCGGDCNHCGRSCK